MNLHLDAVWNVYQGSLENGGISKPKITEKSKYTSDVHPVNTAEISGGNDVVIIQHLGKIGDMEFLTPRAVRKVSLRTVNYKYIDVNHHWDMMALNKLWNDRGIIPVEPDVYIARKIGDIRYQERLDSFYIDRGTDSEKFAHPTFADLTRFNPETLAAYGWEHKPAAFENEDEAKLSLDVVRFMDEFPAYAEELLRHCAAKDEISSLSYSGSSSFYGFKESESFPDGLVGRNSDANDQMLTIIKAIKHIQETAIFTRNGEPCSAAVVKLTGRQTYLLTPEENKNQLQFDSFPASELLKYYRESWKEYMDDTAFNEFDDFERHTLHTLRRLLPEINPDLKMINSFLEEVSTVSSEIINAFVDGIQTPLKEAMIEFESIYQEFLLAEKQIEFYKVITVKVQEVLDIMNGRIQKLMVSASSECIAVYVIFQTQQQLDQNDPRYSSIKKDSDLYKKEREEEKEYAESKLISLERKLRKVRLKMGAQPELESLLVSVAACVVGEIYKNHDAADTDNKKRSLFENVNNILGLIHKNNNLKYQDFSRNIEALNLAAEKELSKLGNTTEKPQVSKSLTASQTMRLPSSQPRQQSDSVKLLNTDLHEAGCSLKRSTSLSALAPTPKTILKSGIQR